VLHSRSSRRLNPPSPNFVVASKQPSTAICEPAHTR
jgi:hypothetical protein